MRRPLTTFELSQICERYQAGESSIKIASALSRDASTVRRAAIRNGVAIRPLLKLDQEQQHELISKYLSGMSSGELSGHFNLSKDAILKYLKRQGVTRRSMSECHKDKSIDTDEIIRLRRLGYSGLRIAKELDIGYVTIIERLRKEKLKLSTMGRTSAYLLNEAAFDVITEESAYWIGFLMADGCISQIRGWTPRVSLSLAIYDAAHVEQFRAFLKSSHRLFFNKQGNAVTLTVASRHLCDTLAAYGVVPRKSLTAKVVGLENDRHFWRGVVDGDGSISLPNSNAARIQVAGSQDLMQQFSEFVYSHNSRCYAKVRKLEGRNLYEFKACGIHIMRLLYENCSVALPRKLERVQTVLAHLS